MSRHRPPAKERPVRFSVPSSCALALLVGTAAACGADPEPLGADAAETGAPATDGHEGDHGHDEGVNLPEASGQIMTFPAQAMDQTPDREVVDVHIRASRHVFQVGRLSVSGYAYNEKVPGPTVRVQKGQRVRVHFENGLDVPTSLQWHGVDLPYAVNGANAPGALVQPGHRFLYEFDATKEGTYWYHSGVDVARQTDYGLYGAFVVVDMAQPQPDYDLVMFFDVWNEIQGNHVHEPELIPDGEGEGDHGDHDDQGDHGDHAGHGVQAPQPVAEQVRSEGRTPWQDDPGHGDHGPGSLPEGQTPGKVLWSVNSQIEPIAQLAPGKSVRARLINVSNMGYLKLHGINGVQIGGDQGLLAAPKSPEGLLLAPGDRAEISGLNGQSVVVNSQYTRFGPGNDSLPALRHRVFEVNMGAGGVGKELPYPFTFEQPAADPKSTDILLTFQGDPRTAAWSINGERFPNVTAHQMRLGQRTYIELRNLSGSEQPFHLRGNAFEVLSVDGVAPLFKTVQDTFNVQRMQRVRIAVDASNPGAWTAQSQILEHAASGMMTVIQAHE